MSQLLHGEGRGNGLWVREGGGGWGWGVCALMRVSASLTVSGLYILLTASPN